MAQDPFFAVKADVESSISNAQVLFDSWRRISQTVTSPNNQELQWAADELRGTLAAMETDLDDLQETISVVENEPVKFGLTDGDVQTRRNFIAQTRTRVDKMREAIDRPLPNIRTENPYQESNDHYIENEAQSQQVLFAEQDEQLEGVHGTVRVLREQADHMNRELGTHATLLDEVDTAADKTTDKLKRAMGRVTYIIRKNEDTRSSCCIGILILVLIILLILVIIL